MEINRIISKDLKPRMMDPLRVIVDVPEGVAGDWRIEKFTVSQVEADLFNFGNSRNARSGRDIDPDTYTRLMYQGTVVMSDTPAEKRDHIEFISRAKRHILINGLGLGYAVEACGRKSSVQRITVIEMSSDVLLLSKQHYLNKYPDKVEIIHADAFTWTPPKEVRYDAVWHDIWNHICSDNLKEMDQLYHKYKGISDWQGSWCRNDCEKMAKIETQLQSRRASGPHHFDEDEVA